MTLVAGISALGPASLELTVRPLVMMKGQTVHIRCRVPVHDDNRTLTIGLDGVRSSLRSLVTGTITHDLWIDEVDTCGSPQAFCLVTDKFDHITRVTQDLRVRGCWGEDAPNDDLP